MGRRGEMIAEPRDWEKRRKMCSGGCQVRVVAGYWGTESHLGRGYVGAGSRGRQHQRRGCGRRVRHSTLGSPECEQDMHTKAVETCGMWM